MNIKSVILGAALGAVGLASSALASSVTPPGERVGIDLATPLPEGVYFVDTGGPGNWRAGTGTSNFDYNVPILAWATPWTIGAGRIQLIAAAPMASLSANNLQKTGLSAQSRGIYNPFVAAQYAYNFGNGFSASYLVGAYIGITGSTVTIGGAGANLYLQDPWNQTTLHQQLALAWHGGGWNATANLMYGIVFQNQTCHCNYGLQADYFNYDLALTHTFGKWEIGIVGYGSTDTSSMGMNYFGRSPFNGGTGSVYYNTRPIDAQFALGGLIGYNFGPVITQFVLATDVYESNSNGPFINKNTGNFVNSNYVAKETRLGIHVIIPLWNPPAPVAVVAKY
jgi:hypothetical protein